MRYMVFVLITGFMFLLVGCSSVNSAAEEKYPLLDIVYDGNGNQSKVYRAYNTEVDKVTKSFTEDIEPIDSYTSDERSVLIYDEYLVQVFQDIEDPDDSIVEVSEEDFVQSNYSTEFFEKYEVAAAAEDAYDLDYNDRYGSTFIYTGYIGKGGYIKNTGSVPSVRTTSNTGNTVRGGGPGAGK